MHEKLPSTAPNSYSNYLLEEQASGLIVAENFHSYQEHKSPMNYFASLQPGSPKVRGFVYSKNGATNPSGEHLWIAERLPAGVESEYSSKLVSEPVAAAVETKPKQNEKQSTRPKPIVKESGNLQGRAPAVELATPEEPEPDKEAVKVPRMVSFEETGETVDLADLRQKFGREPYRVAYTTEDGSTYALTKRDLYKYDPVTPAGTRTFRKAADMEDGEQDPPVATIGELWQYAAKDPRGVTTAPIRRVDVIYEETADVAEAKEVQPEKRLVRYNAYKDRVQTAAEYAKPGTEIKWSDLDDKEAIFYTKDGRKLYLSGIVDEDSGENQKKLYDLTKSEQTGEIDGWGLLGQKPEDLPSIVLGEELRLWNGAKPAGEIKKIVVENGAYKADASTLDGFEPHGNDPFQRAERLVTSLEKSIVSAKQQTGRRLANLFRRQRVSAEADSPESHAGRFQGTPKYKRRRILGWAGATLVAAVMGVGLAEVASNSDPASHPSPNVPAKKQTTTERTTPGGQAAAHNAVPKITIKYGGRKGHRWAEAVLPKSLR